MNDTPDSFDTLTLPPVLLAGMYEHSIVVADSSAPVTARKLRMAEARETGKTPSPSPVAIAAEMAEASATLSPAEKTVPTWLGKFSRQVLIIVQEPDAVYCSDANLEFLTRVLGAVSLSLDHVAIVNTARQALSFAELTQALPARVALFFGPEPAAMGVPMRFPHFQVQPWGGCTFLYCPSLAGLNGNTELQVQQKRSLWEALRKIFAGG